MTRNQAALVLGVAGALVAVSVAELGSDPTPWVVAATPDAGGLLGPLVRAADGAWDVGLLRFVAVLAGVVVALAFLVVLEARGERTRRRAAGVAVAVVAVALLVPATLLQVGLRDATAPWFHTNDSTLQIELAGDLVLDGTSPYGHDYDGTGMERIYSLDGTPPPPDAEIAALGAFPYFPGMVVYGTLVRLAPAPLDDARILLLLCTLALLPAALLLRAPLHVRLAVGLLLAANPLMVRGAWFGTVDAPAILLLVLAFAAVQRRRFTAALALVGGAVLLKQFAIVAAPFLLVEAWRHGGRAALVRPALAFGAVLLLPILPFLVVQPGDFWADTITFGAEAYRVVGYGLSNALVRLGVVERSGDYPFALVALATWLPVTVLLLRAQRRPDAPAWVAPAAFAASMLVLVVVARVFQTSYLAYPLAGVLVAVAVGSGRDAERPPA